jgi:hypothetical protein
MTTGTFTLQRSMVTLAGLAIAATVSTSAFAGKTLDAIKQRDQLV